MKFVITVVLCIAVLLCCPKFVDSIQFSGMMFNPAHFRSITATRRIPNHLLAAEDSLLRKLSTTDNGYKRKVQLTRYWAGKAMELVARAQIYFTFAMVSLWSYDFFRHEMKRFPTGAKIVLVCTVGLAALRTIAPAPQRLEKEIKDVAQYSQDHYINPTVEEFKSRVCNISAPMYRNQFSRYTTNTNTPFPFDETTTQWSIFGLATTSIVSLVYSTYLNYKLFNAVKENQESKIFSSTD